MIELTPLAVVLMAFSVAMYVILDGFDLGIGILFPFARNSADRTTMMHSIAPVWDGNETWLILGGGLLFAAFPSAYAILLPAWYLPFMLFLFALMFRGVSFEFRAMARNKSGWSAAFSIGSILAAFAQGIVLGSFIEGFTVRNGHFAGSVFDAFTPFSLLTGVGLCTGYALLGATWLVLKTEGALQNWAYRAAKSILPILLLFIAAVSLWTPWAQPAIAARWFNLPNVVYLSPVPTVTALLAWRLWHALYKRKERAPFQLSIGLFMLSYFGLAVSLWPYIVPRVLTVWDAAAPLSTLAFALIGVGLLLPLILGYTFFTYRIFSGKVVEGDHY